ncbi:MAG TPA: 7TM-DISM domain-containing protein, partial [Pseudomonadales bacterium]|nr:7TM-DISM domain-containing protein [Pseudomonadales bacterium]
MAWLACFCCLHAWAEDACLRLDDTTANVRPSQGIYLLRDPAGALNFDAIRAADAAGKFALLPGQNLNFGASHDTLWLRFKVKNKSTSLSQYYLTIDYPLLDSIDAYFVDEEGNFKLRSTGDSYPFSQRPLQTFSFHIPFTVAPQNGGLTIYIRVHSTSNLIVPIYLSTQEHLVEWLDWKRLIDGVFYGITFGLLVYNLMLFFTIRESHYILIALNTIGCVLIIGSVDGLLYRLWPDNIFMEEIAALIIVNFTNIVMQLFSSQFMAVPQYHPTYYKWVQRFIYVCALVIIAEPFVDMTIIAYITMVLSFGTVIMGTVSGILAYRRKHPFSGMFLLSWSMLIIGASFAILSVVGFITDFQLSIWGYKIGFVCALLMLSITLGMRINQLKAEQANSERDFRMERESNLAKSEFLARMSHEI